MEWSNDIVTFFLFDDVSFSERCKWNEIMNESVKVWNESMNEIKEDLDEFHLKATAVRTTRWPMADRSPLINKGNIYYGRKIHT